MILELEAYQVIGLLITVAGSIFGAGKALFARFDASLRDRDDSLKDELGKLSNQMASESAAIRKLDREMLELKAELPREYVAKADFIRSFTVVEGKLDAVYNLIMQKNKD
ncbi:hypothetical protein [Psychrobacter celer]|uniref:hypothetical protein n=1 Tax=Psychrobacter celer TaxID=306572 RepID=UPI002FE469EF